MLQRFVIYSTVLFTRNKQNWNVLETKGVSFNNT